MSLIWQGKPGEVRDVPVPSYADDEILIKISHVSLVCDLHNSNIRRHDRPCSLSHPVLSVLTCRTLPT